MKQRAVRYLSRLAGVTGPSSFIRALTDGTIKVVVSNDDDKVVKSVLEAELVREDAINQEGLTLAHDNDWVLQPNGAGHERWPRLDDARLFDAIPRIYRILTRESWELENMARECDNEDVSSLLFQFAAHRKAFANEFNRRFPIASELGA